MSATAQHMKALEHGNTIRLERARLRREIAALTYVEGCVLAAQVITSPPARCEREPVVKVITAIRHVGPFRARHVLHEAGVGERATLGALTDRQRGALSRELERKG